MMMKIAVCDDEQLECILMQRQLERFLSERGSRADIRIYSSGSACLCAMAQADAEDYPDLFLLDIYMEGQNGIELARSIRDMGAKGNIIFVTGGNEYASEAFEVGAFYYLKKPVNYDKLCELLEKAFRSFEKRRYLEIVEDREQKRVYVEDIIWMETLNRRLTIYTDKREYGTYMSLKELMSQLPEEEFVKTSRFAAVSLDKIDTLRGRMLTLKDGTELSLGDKFYMDVRERYESFLERHRGG